VGADIVKMLKHILVRKAKDSPSQMGKRLISNLIALDTLIECVARAIDFDHQFVLRAGEIDDVAGDRHLPSKAQSHQTMGSHRIPEAQFSRRQRFAHPPCVPAMAFRNGVVRHGSIHHTRFNLSTAISTRSGVAGASSLGQIR